MVRCVVLPFSFGPFPLQLRSIAVAVAVQHAPHPPSPTHTPNKNQTSIFIFLFLKPQGIHLDGDCGILLFKLLLAILVDGVPLH